MKQILLLCMSFAILQAMEETPYVTLRELMYSYGLSYKEAIALGKTISDERLKELQLIKMVKKEQQYWIHMFNRKNFQKNLESIL